MVHATACPSSLSSNSSLNIRLTSCVSIIPSSLAVHCCLARYPAPHTDAFCILFGISGCLQPVTWFTLPSLPLTSEVLRGTFLVGQPIGVQKPGYMFPIGCLYLPLYRKLPGLYLLSPISHNPFFLKPILIRLWFPHSIQSALLKVSHASASQVLGPVPAAIPSAGTAAFDVERLVR